MRIDKQHNVRPKFELSRVWVALYSQLQRAVHVERLDEFIADEVEEILTGRVGGGYRLVFASRSQAEVRGQAARWQQSRNNKEI
jgi:hypothetical protein